MGRRPASETCRDGYWPVGQVATRLGLSLATVRSHARLLGLLGGVGRGNHVCFSSTEVLAIAVADRLKRQGVRSATVARACAYLASHLPGQTPLAGYSFFTDGHTILVETGDPAVVLDVGASGQLVFGMALRDVVLRCQQAGLMTGQTDVDHIEAAVRVRWQPRQQIGPHA